ncbi:unnamed protein product [Pleuronectes platessa]|uniref:Uncharacterized protein n=1 Tax=Pleuronectes platessa TaxID=8262 RepID=A0A9N7Z5X5_PLEPL|nr:unnamed protein product [Pleuronectes platessa]
MDMSPEAVVSTRRRISEDEVKSFGTLEVSRTQLKGAVSCQIRRISAVAGKVWGQPEEPPEMSVLLQGPWWSVALHAVIRSPWCAEVRMPTEEDAAAPCVLRRIIWQQTRQRGGPKKRGYPLAFKKATIYRG